MTSKRHVAKFNLSVSDGTHAIVFVDCKGKPNWKRHPHHAGRFECVSRRTLTDRVTIGDEYLKALKKDGLSVEQAQRLATLLLAATADDFLKGDLPLDGWNKREQAKYGIDRYGRKPEEDHEAPVLTLVGMEKP